MSRSLKVTNKNDVDFVAAIATNEGLTSINEVISKTIWKLCLSENRIRKKDGNLKIVCDTWYFKGTGVPL